MKKCWQIPVEETMVWMRLFSFISCRRSQFVTDKIWLSGSDRSFGHTFEYNGQERTSFQNFLNQNASSEKDDDDALEWGGFGSQSERFQNSCGLGAKLGNNGDHKNILFTQKQQSSQLHFNLNADFFFASFSCQRDIQILLSYKTDLASCFSG